MTEKKREKIAKEFRRKLDRDVLRKNAIAEICAAYGIARSTLYQFCARHGVSTR